MDKVPAIIVDIDGTIADISHRLHFIEWETKDWEGFYWNLSEDKPKQDIIDLIKTLIFDSEADEYTTYPIIFVTWRSEKYLAATLDWIYKNILWYKIAFFLFMRKDWDFRQDYEIKKEIYDNEIKDKYDVKYVFEDRDQVVKMYRELWLTVLQVANWDF